MTSIRSLLNPSTYNQVQRVGAFVVIALLLLVIVLHNPIHGYQTEEWISCVDIPAYLCPDKPREFGLLEWRSTGAMIEALRPLGSALLALAALFLAAAAWLALFKTKTE